MEKAINKSELFKFCIFLLCWSTLQCVYVFWDGAELFPTVNDSLTYKQIAQDIKNGQVISIFHYPILYPLLLSIGFYADYFLIGMCVANVVVKIVLLIPIYLLLRKIVDEPFWCTVIISFTPIYFMYSRFLLAENLMAPLLILCCLYHIVYRKQLADDAVSGKKKLCLTVGAALLALSVYWSKYIALVLFPVFCIYWGTAFSAKMDRKSRIYSFLKTCIIYTVSVLLCILGYGIYCSYRLETEFTFSFLTTTMGIDNGTGASHIGFDFFTEMKWIICYLAYTLLCTFPMVFVVTSFVRKSEKLRKNKGILIFFAVVSAVLIYVAARHSTYVAYNADGGMLKLLGRYVSYIAMLGVICLFLVWDYDKIYLKQRILPLIGTVIYSLVIPYLLLYKKLLWDNESDWLDRVRGLENYAFLKGGWLTCILYILGSILIVLLLKKKKLILGSILLCVIFSLNYIVAMVTLEEDNVYIQQHRDVKNFVDQNAGRETLVLCNEKQMYGNMLQIWAFYKDFNEPRTVWTTPIVYRENDVRQIDRENAWFMLKSDSIQIENWDEKQAGYINLPNSDYIFLDWDSSVFEEKLIETEIYYDAENRVLYVRFDGDENTVLMSGNNIFSAEYEHGSWIAKIDTTKFSTDSIFRVYNFSALQKSQEIYVSQ